MCLSITGIIHFGTRYRDYVKCSGAGRQVPYIYEDKYIFRGKGLSYYMKASYNGRSSKIEITRAAYDALDTGVFPLAFDGGSRGLFSLEDRKMARGLMNMSILTSVVLFLLAYAHVLDLINSRSKRVGR